MMHFWKPNSRSFFGQRGLFIAFLLAAAPSCAQAAPPPAALSAFNSYIGAVEARLERQHRSQAGFLAPQPAPAQAGQRLRQGDLIVERLTPATGTEFDGAMLHHWRGTAFAPGATAADFERLMKDFDAYPKHYSPQVLQAKVLSRQGDRLQATMRVRQRHILTVVMDTAFVIEFGRLDARHGYSISRSTQISEIEFPGTRHERALSPSEDQGFLWRLSTFWSYEERDGGLYMQIESVSLTRSIPASLGWAIGPFVESVPRESLEFTLRSTVNALRK
jgi:hypothetical protein